jgi:integrase
LDLESGAPRATGVALVATIERYFHAHPQLRPRTLEDYHAVTSKFVNWAASNGIVSADALTRPVLIAFRETLIAEPKRAPLQGRGQRGRRKPVAQRRSPQTINSELRRLRTVLGYLCDLDLCVRLSHDDLRRSFKQLAVGHERVEYLRPSELRALLESARRHDAETFAITRAEHAGYGIPGSTHRYDAIAPFIAFVMLTGMRFGEALAVEWGQIDLTAKDWDGRQAGEIYLKGHSTKTHKARTVGLDVSPGLHRLLAAMRLRVGGKGRVFELTAATALASAKRLKRDYGAPSRYGWQMLRRTCGTFLTNAPGIFGAASAYRSAKQLGHSVAIAERHYVDVARGISPDARNLETAMQIADLISAMAQQIGESSAKSPYFRGTDHGHQRSE